MLGLVPERNGERARLGRCSARPRGELLHLTDEPSDWASRAGLPTAGAPLAAPEAGALPEFHPKSQRSQLAPPGHAAIFTAITLSQRDKNV